MMDGTIVQSAPPEMLYHQPATREVAAFVGEANFLPGTAKNGRRQLRVGRHPDPG